MSVSFAAARSVSASPVARVLARRTLAQAANDDRALGVVDDAILQAALRHFAVHGLGAAKAAHDEALRARQAGDVPGQDKWTAICRLFDKRLAEDIEPVSRKATLA